MVKIGFRQVRTHILRTILLVFGIALGVSGVVAIDIAKTSVSKSFELSTTTMTSRSTHQIMGNNFRVPQSFFTRLRTVLGIHRSAPVITTPVSVNELNNTSLVLMGIDPFSEMYFRDFSIHTQPGNADTQLSRLLEPSSGVLVSRAIATRNGLNQGDRLTLTFGTRQVPVLISGLLDSSDASTNAAFEGLILADISLAQEILGFKESISRIDLILPDEATAGKIQGLLPDGTALVKTDHQNQVIRRLSKSFETSLTAFSMLALFMGIFLIYNTVSFSIAQRQKLNGTLRALGATRMDIFYGVMVEVMAYAFIGSVLGICLGILLGKAAVLAVCSTVSDIYFALTVSKTHIAGATILKGILAGIASAAAAAFFPAMTAATTLPITLMHRSAAESALQKRIPQLTIVGGLIIGAAVLIPTHLDVHPGYDFAGVFLIFLGAALLSPRVILLMVSAMAIMAKPSAGVLTKMALRNIVRSLSRTSVLIASLMVVTSVYIGIDIMTASFRLSIIDWVDGHIGGDIHVSSSDHLNRSLNPGLLEKIQALPSVSGVSAYNIHRIFSRTSGEVHIFSYVSDLSKKQWTWTAQGQENVAALFDQGWIVVSEIFAQRNQIRPARGVTVVLETIKGPRSFKIAGIFRDFFMGGGRVIVNRDAMDQFWGHQDITAMQLFLKPNQPIESVMERIRSFEPATAGLKVISGASIKQRILGVFDKTFVITSALQILTAIVALTGILNSVMALLIERTRELGILRACGAERYQVGRLLLLECGLSGLISGIMALPLGVCLAWVLIHVVNQRSFGWTYDMVLCPGVFVQAVSLACLAAVVAGIFPAVKAGRTDIGNALRME
jgi:putative ABC transport system permease protein